LKKYFSSYWIRSAFYTFLQRFSLTFFGLINLMVLIRSLSKLQMGTWALFLVVLSIFETTKSGLLKNAHIHFVTGSKKTDEKSSIASSSLLINSLISLLFIFFILFFSEWLSSSLHAGNELAVMLKWFIPGLICMVFFSHLEAIQQSHLDFKGVFAGHFVRQTTFFLIIVIHYLLKIPFSLKWLALYQSAGILLGMITLYIYTRKYMLHRFDPSVAWVKKIIGFGGYIFGSGLLSNIFANLDFVMIATFMSASSVAYYNTAARINGFVDIPSYAASEILFPKVSHASAHEGSGKVKYLYERMVAILLSFTIPAAIFIILFPRLVITIIAGTTYLAAAPILQLYMITGILRPMQNQAANILNSIGKPALCFIMNAVSMAAYLVINYICLLSFGFYGAAIGTLITCSLGTFAWYFVMKKQIGLQLMNVIKYIRDFYIYVYSQALNFFSKANKAAT
jgi:lipopolysaccharide exporter